MPTISPLKKLGPARVQCIVTVAADEVKKAEDAAIAKLGGSVTIPGFRPGKAPADQVRGKINSDQLLEETVRSLLPTILEQILKEQKVQPIIPPKIEVQSVSPLTLALTFVERPEVKMKKVDMSQLKKTEPKFDEKDIDRMVQYLLSQYRTFEQVERAATDTDQVTMDFVGTDKEGKEIQGTRATGYKVIIGSKTLLPGFEDALLGMKKGEKKSFDLVFPDKYHAEQLQGKPVTFTVDVKGVEKVITPTLTPEFVKEKGLGDSPEDMRTRIAASMKEEEERMDRQRHEQKLFEAIRAATQIEIPPELIETELRTLIEDLQTQLEQQKTMMQEWMQRTKRTPESVEKELREEATKRITLRFGVQKLLEDDKIELTPDDIKAAIDQRLADVPQDQRIEAASYFGEGGEGHEEVKWAKRVEKLVGKMLA